MVTYTTQLNTKNYQKHFNWQCRKVLDDVRTHVTSSAASRDSAVKLTTDSYQFWVAHLNLHVTFQSYVRFARNELE